MNNNFKNMPTEEILDKKIKLRESLQEAKKEVSERQASKFITGKYTDPKKFWELKAQVSTLQIELAKIDHELGLRNRKEKIDKNAKEELFRPSLRDLFAGFAMAGLLANPKLAEIIKKEGPEFIDRNVWLYADKVIERRDKNNE
jgi:hypothetical protein